MNANTIFVLRAATRDALVQALRGLGLPIQETAYAEELVCNGTCTPPMVTDSGTSIAVACCLSPDQTAMIPTIINPPDLVCDYRSDEEGSVWPEYQITRLDDEGQPVTYLQAMNMIAT